MAVNRFDKPAEARFIETYAPINFDALYRIGAANKEAVDQAEKELAANIRTFGSFQSMSNKDVENYYRESIGKFKDLVQYAAENPEAMKSASFRSSLQQRINSIDYAKLSQYAQNAANLKERASNIAKMKAEGTYNPEWDTIDIANWDTDTQKIMDELSPVKYLTANQLSNAYFDNMKQGTIGSTWKDGVKYTVTGNTYEDLLSVAKAHENDLINTPQGAMYMKRFLQQTGGDESKAREMFTDMIAQSQIDRTLRPTLTVDPAWLAMAKSEAGSKQTQTLLPTRQQQIGKDLRDRVTTTVTRSLSDKEIQRYNELAKNSNNFQIYLDQLYKKYSNIKGTDPASEKTKDNLITKIKQFEDFKRRTDEQLNGYLYSTALKNEFKNITNKDIKQANKLDKNDYNKGVKGALDNIASVTSIFKEDPMLTLIGGKYKEYTQSDGSIVNTYDFNTSKGFLLPETVFQLSTNTPAVDNKRRAGFFRSDEFLFRELLESGQFNNVQFIPNGDNNTIQLGSNKLISGKLRISKDNIEQLLGTGIGHGKYQIGPEYWVAPFTRQSTRTALEDLFNGKTVKYGEDGTKYYEVDVWKQLPADDVMNYWNPVNQLHLNTPSTPSGVGGATEASGNHPYSLQTLMQQ